jgi:hypothetical protein
LNEKELAKFIYEMVVGKSLGKWYDINIKGTKLSDTLDTISHGVYMNEIK